jgi:hypothetical protein
MNFSSRFWFDNQFEAERAEYLLHGLEFRLDRTIERFVQAQLSCGDGPSL